MRPHLRRSVLVLLAAALAGCPAKTEDAEAAKKPEGRGGGDANSTDSRIPVRAEAARREALGHSLEASAPLEALRVVEVHSEVAGRVRKLGFEVGQRLEAGALLVELEDPDLVRQLGVIELTLEQKKTAHEKAGTRLREIESELRTARIDVSELATKQAMLEGQVARETERLADKTKLWEKKLIQKSDFDAAAAAVETSRNELDATRFARQRKEVAIEDLEGLEKEKARLEVETARLEVLAEERKKIELQADMAKMAIRAPEPGVVTASGAEEGKWVTKETQVAVLALLDPLVVRVRLPEREIPLLATGQPVTITSPTLEAMRLTIAGRVDEVSGLVDAASGTVECRVRVLEAHPALRPGMLVRCRIEVFRNESAVVVPKRAIVWEDGEAFVFRIEDGKAVRVAVELGHGRDNDVEIRTGIEPGARIVTVGNKTLKDGTAVVEMETP